MNTLNYIINEISAIENYNKHIKNAKEIKITFYKNNVSKLNKIPK